MDRYVVSSRAPGDSAPPAAAPTYGEDSEGPFQGWMTGEKTEGSVYTGLKSLLTRWKR